MANPLSIYSGPGQISCYDAVNNLLALGYSREINLTGEPQHHELMDGNLHQYSTLFKLSAVLLQSNQDLLNQLKARRAQRQEIVVVGLESALRVKNVYPALKITRPFKADSPHTIELLAQTAVEEDVLHFENLLGSNGSFENDADADGFADGWQPLGNPQGNLAGSFLSGQGNCQSVQSQGSLDGIFSDLLLPFEDEIKLTFSIYAFNPNAGEQSVNLFLEFFDPSDNSLARYVQSELLVGNEVRRLSMSRSVSNLGTVKTVRAGVEIVGSNIDLQFDNAQLELGELTDFKPY